MCTCFRTYALLVSDPHLDLSIVDLPATRLSTTVLNGYVKPFRSTSDVASSKQRGPATLHTGSHHCGLHFGSPAAPIGRSCWLQERPVSSETSANVAMNIVVDCVNASRRYDGGQVQVPPPSSSKPDTASGCGAPPEVGELLYPRLGMLQGAGKRCKHQNRLEIKVIELRFPTVDLISHRFG